MDILAFCLSVRILLKYYFVSILFASKILLQKDRNKNSQALFFRKTEFKLNCQYIANACIYKPS